MTHTVHNITSQNFETEVLQSQSAVLIDFWAPWCGPCKQLAPILEDLAQEFGAELKIGKINVDETPDLAQKYGVRSIPTLLLFKDGQVLVSKVGLGSQAELSQWIKSSLS